MKYLKDYMEEKQTELFKTKGVFFAFSNEQFTEGCEKVGADDKNKICRLGLGMFCLAKNADEVKKRLNEIYYEAIKQDIAENGIEAIIKRELANHECYYTGDISDCVEKLADYEGITPEMINDVFRGKKIRKTK
jgi:hypothetical protein